MDRELDVNMSVQEIVNRLNIYNLAFGLKVLKVVHNYKYKDLAKMMDLSQAGVYQMIKHDSAESVFKEQTLQRAIYRLQITIEVEEKLRRGKKYVK